jgi:TonB family protein
MTKKGEGGDTHTMPTNGTGKPGVPGNPNGVPNGVDGSKGRTGTKPGGPEAPATPRPTPTPTPTPAPTPRPTPKPTPPKPKGPTRDAEFTYTPSPSMPESLRHQNLRTSVRVHFDIGADGSCSASLMGSTGNAELDSIVLSACNRWRARPRLEEGVPVSSTQRITVRFTNE